MSYCPKCGRTYKNNGFKCGYCGAPLAYSQSGKGPSLIDRIMRYKSFLILLAVAVLVSMVSAAAKSLNILYWAIIVGALAGAVILFLKNKNRSTSYGSRSHDDRNSYGGQSHYGAGQAGPRRKHTNVIPLKKRRDSKDKK